MVAFAISALYVPNRIISGGASGTATILYYILEMPTGLSLTIINGGLLILAFAFLERGFLIKTLVYAMLLSLFVHIFSYVPPLIDNAFLATVFGGVFYGCGSGIVLTHGGSTGGTEIVGRLLQKMTPSIKIGTVLLLINSLIILSSQIVFGDLERTLYSVMALAISSFTVNRIVLKLNVSKLALVITGDGEHLAQELLAHFRRGVTVLDAVGAYTRDNKSILLCALKEKEWIRWQKQVQAIDPNAFIILVESEEIIGRGFRIYR